MAITARQKQGQIRAEEGIVFLFWLLSLVRSLSNKGGKLYRLSAAQRSESSMTRIASAGFSFLKLSRPRYVDPGRCRAPAAAALGVKRNHPAAAEPKPSAPHPEQ